MIHFERKFWEFSNFGEIFEKKFINVEKFVPENLAWDKLFMIGKHSHGDDI